MSCIVKVHILVGTAECKEAMMSQLRSFESAYVTAIKLAPREEAPCSLGYTVDILYYISVTACIALVEVARALKEDWDDIIALDLTLFTCVGDILLDGAVSRVDSITVAIDI